MADCKIFSKVVEGVYILVLIMRAGPLLALGFVLACSGLILMALLMGSLSMFIM